MAYINRWKHVWLLRSLFVFEFLLLTALLGLIGYANPDTFTTKLRLDGALNGFNSSPAISTGASTPYVWTTTLTKYNLSLSVASFLLFVVQGALYILEFYVPVVAVVLKAALMGAWGFSVHSQSGSDYTDSKHPSPSPWYLRKSCDVVYYQSNKNYCHEAKATFGISVMLLACYGAIIVLAVVSLLAERPPGMEKKGQDVEDGNGSDNDSLELDGGARW